MHQDKITAKQTEILEYIKECVLKKGYPPSVREICEAVHLKSTSSVHSHLATLEEKGYIRRDPTKPRTIEIIDEEFNPARRELVNIPVVGTVAAGQPILAEENISDYLLIVRIQNTAENGDKVVALLDDSATVKTFYKEDGHYRLQPENDSMDPIIADHVQILGKVVGVIRIM